MTSSGIWMLLWVKVSPVIQWTVQPHASWTSWFTGAIACNWQLAFQGWKSISWVKLAKQSRESCGAMQSMAKVRVFVTLTCYKPNFTCYFANIFPDVQYSWEDGALDLRTLTHLIVAISNCMKQITAFFCYTSSGTYGHSEESYTQ